MQSNCRLPQFNFTNFQCLALFGSPMRKPKNAAAEKKEQSQHNSAREGQGPVTSEHGSAPIQMKRASSPIQPSSESQSPVMRNDLPESVLGKMENSFGEDFSGVKIHQNSLRAQGMGALAFAQGEEVHFAPGQYQPHDVAGQRLIGHELAHVVQQRGGGIIRNSDEKSELAADEAGDKSSKGFKVDAMPSVNFGAIQCKYPVKPDTPLTGEVGIKDGILVGNSMAEIAVVQYYLFKSGFLDSESEIDGALKKDGNTVNAIIAFQKATGLEQTGYISHNKGSFEKLKSICSIPNMEDVLKKNATNAANLQLPQHYGLPNFDQMQIPRGDIGQFGMNYQNEYNKLRHNQYKAWANSPSGIIARQPKLYFNQDNRTEGERKRGHEEFVRNQKQAEYQKRKKEELILGAKVLIFFGTTALCFLMGPEALWAASSLQSSAATISSLTLSQAMNIGVRGMAFDVGKQYFENYATDAIVNDDWNPFNDLAKIDFADAFLAGVFQVLPGGSTIQGQVLNDVMGATIDCTAEKGLVTLGNGKSLNDSVVEFGINRLKTVYGGTAKKDMFLEVEGEMVKNLKLIPW